MRVENHPKKRRASWRHCIWWLPVHLATLRLSSSEVGDEFEWDDAKAALNLREHGVSFELAREDFLDPFALEWLDTSEDYGEDRYLIIGMIQTRLVLAVYTPRGERKRLISARGAEPYERRRYHEESE